MANTHIWIGSASSNAGSASSWSTGIAPSSWVEDDEVVFDPLVSQASCLVNVDRSANEVRSITTKVGYLGDLGTSSNPFKIKLNGATSTIAGDGTAYLEMEVPDGTDNVVIDSPNNENAAVISGHVINFSVKAGKVTMTSDVVFHEFSVVTVIGSSAWLIIQGTGTTWPKALDVEIGRCDNARDQNVPHESNTGSEINVAAYGRLYQTGLLADPFRGVHTSPGAYFNYQPRIDPGGGGHISHGRLYGHTDFTDTKFPHQWTLFIVGPTSIYQGGPVQPLQIFIDLREKYSPN